jgi:hypothetical protein
MEQRQALGQGLADLGALSRDELVARHDAAAAALPEPWTDDPAVYRDELRLRMMELQAETLERLWFAVLVLAGVVLVLGAVAIVLAV